MPISRGRHGSGVTRLTLPLAVIVLALLAPPADAWYCYSTITDCNPTPPMVLVGEVRDDGIHLMWEAPVYGAVGEYRVHRRSADGGETVFSAGQDLAYVDTPDKDGTYVYFITGMRGMEESVPSNPFASTWPHCQPAGVLPFPGVYTGCLTPLPGNALDGLWP